MEMKSIKSHDGLELFYRVWPVKNPRGHIALIHGYGEHIGRYERLAGDLNKAGFYVHGYDQRNHGNSPGKRGFIERFDFLVKDAGGYLRQVTQEAGEQPLFFMGHSMGGLVLSRVLQEYGLVATGAVFSSPFLQIGGDVSPFLISIGNVLSVFLPNLPVVDLQPEKISSMPEEVAAYINDPLVFHERIVARTGSELNKAVAAAREGMGKIDLPVYILHGAQDQLAPVGGGEYLFEHVASVDKTFKRYESGLHELFNDAGREEVLKDLLGWLVERVE